MNKSTIAFHEAGHAVAVVVLGRGRLGPVSIQPDHAKGTLEWYSAGRAGLPIHLTAKATFGGGASEDEWTAFKLGETERYVITLLAGEAAQRIYSPQSFRPTHSEGIEKSQLMLCGSWFRRLKSGFESRRLWKRQR